MRGLEAEVDIENAKEAAEKQAGADEEKAGESDFTDYENGTHAAVASTFTCTTACVLERLLRITAGDSQARS